MILHAITQHDMILYDIAQHNMILYDITQQNIRTPFDLELRMVLFRSIRSTCFSVRS